MSNIINFCFSSIFSLSAFGYTVLALVAYFYYSRIVYPYYLGPLRNLPRGKSGLLHYFSYMYGFAIGDASIVLKLSQKHGPVVHLTDDIVLINDTEVRKHYNSYKFSRAKVYKMFNINGQNLFSATDKQFHARMKKLILPAFNNKSLAAMEGTIYKFGSESLVQYINSFLETKSEHELDILKLLYRNTLDVISELVFGTSLDCTWDKKRGTQFMEILSRTQFMMFVRSFIPYSNLIKFPIEHYFTPMILGNIRSRKHSNEVHHDILQSMIDAKDPETGLGLTEMEIVDECLMLLFASQETTANTINWTLYELLKQPKIYELVANEIIEKFPNLNEPINSQVARKELKYLEAAILESARKHPAGAGIILREVPEDGLTTNGHYLPPKTVIAVNIFCEHNDPNFWENPREYNINRWLGEDRETNRSKLITFGLGNRSCIGRDYAWNQVYLILTNLIRNFNFELVDKELTPISYFILNPKGNSFKVKVSKRS